MNISNGVILSAKQVASPHFNQRPNPNDISLLVIHNISLPAGKFNNNYVEDFFSGHLDISKHPSLAELVNIKVSAHLFIRRNGEAIQFVNFNQRAWHAGVSTYLGRENCNDFSIGIEMEGTDDIAYTTEQYQQLIKVTKLIMAEYPQIKPEKICGHSDIAPNRKTDPGESFDWLSYKRHLI